MFLYRVDVTIEAGIQQEWEQWMKNKHIPDVLACGVFTKHQFLSEPIKNDKISYTILYYCTSMDSLNNYLTSIAPTLQREHTDKFEGHFTAKRAILQNVN